MTQFDSVVIADVVLGFVFLLISFIGDKDKRKKYIMQSKLQN